MSRQSGPGHATQRHTTMLCTLCEALEDGPEGARRPAAPRRQHVLHLRDPQLLFHVTSGILVTADLVTGHIAEGGILLGTAAGDHVEPTAGAVPGHGSLRSHVLVLLLLQHRLEVDALVILGGNSNEHLLLGCQLVLAEINNKAK